MKEFMKKSHERENQEMNDKIAVCLGKGGQRDMAEAFCRRTGAQLQDKPGDFLTVRFDSRGVSLSGFGLTYQGDFVETMLHRVTRGRLQHEMLVKAVKSDKEGRKAIDATAGMGEDAFLLAAQGYEVTLYEQNPVKMDWRKPLAAFGGQTAFDLASRAFECHISQQRTDYHVEDFGPYDNSKFGLAYSAVGEDVQKDDFFENLE